MRLVMMLFVVIAAHPAAAQTAQWLPGMDLLLPVYADLTDDGAPGAARHLLGYDRDTGTASMLYPADQCYIQWWWRPTQGAGGITHIAQLSPRIFALYHESGSIRIEPLPDASFCVPLPIPVPKGAHP